MTKTTPTCGACDKAFGEDCGIPNTCWYCGAKYPPTPTDADPVCQHPDHDPDNPCACGCCTEQEPCAEFEPPTDTVTLADAPAVDAKRLTAVLRKLLHVHETRAWATTWALLDTQDLTKVGPILAALAERGWTTIITAEGSRTKASIYYGAIDSSETFRRHGFGPTLPLALAAALVEADEKGAFDATT